MSYSAYRYNRNIKFNLDAHIYWEKDFPTPKDLAIMAKYRRLNRY